MFRLHIVLGIRPENVRVAIANDTQTIKGQVYLIENLGMHKLVSVRVKGNVAEPLTVSALLPPGQNWSETEITLAFPPQNVHWFDVQSGDAIG